MLLQGYAWIDMAMEAGGLDRLSYVVSDAEPCRICTAAQVMQEPGAGGDRDFPAPAQRLELFLKAMTVEDGFRFSGAAVDGDDQARLGAGRDTILCGIDGTGPPSPPPQVAVS